MPQVLYGGCVHSRTRGGASAITLGIVRHADQDNRAIVATTCAAHKDAAASAIATRTTTYASEGDGPHNRFMKLRQSPDMFYKTTLRVQAPGMAMRHEDVGKASQEVL